MSTAVILFGDSLRETAKPWLEELGKSDRERLQRLLKLAVAEKTRLSDVLNTLFYGEDTQTALANLTRLRNRLNEVGEPLGLSFKVDTKKKSPPTERTVWFTGPDGAVLRATRFSQQMTADVAGKPFIPSKGIATTGSAMAGKKRVVRFFISYAHENKALAEALVKVLRSQFGASKRYELEFWIDREIMVGEKWNDRILKAIDECHFGLFMVSPDFLGSSYIGGNEIPPFVSGEKCKPVVPVGLVPVSFDRHDLKGLQEHQIFFLRGRAFDQMRLTAEKTEFARHLHEEMEKRLDAYFAVASKSDAVTPAFGEDEETCELQAGVPASLPDLQRFMPPVEETRHFQRTRGYLHQLSQRESLDPARANLGDARDALDELEAWATRKEGSPFFALLGEVGIGKTTTLKQFTRQLLDKRQKEPGKYPLPIYIDLRDYVGSGQADGVPTIEELLTSVIQRSWRVTDRSVTAADLLRLVREEGALILFDGLDEKIVHLTPSRARDFIRTLWSVLPEAMLSRSGAIQVASGKMLVSCRSHYFRDVWSQNAMLTGEDREGLDRSQYPALCLLPFDEGQIRGYLGSFLGDEKRGGEAFDLIASIHNLRDLAERPYLLSLISGRLSELEALQMRGETVNAARLYDLVVRSWLGRDDGKHHLDAMHKRRLMEALAAALWRSGEKQWDVDRLEEWFDEFLHQNPAIASAYANKDRALLKEDLRTATFVLRPDTEEKHFRFAHTSLQEYFLASHLARALADQADAQWEMPMVSVETLDFLGQILATNKSNTAFASLERILGGNCLQAAVLAFKYWLEAIKNGHPEPQPQQVNLAGANCDKWQIKGQSKDRPLNLRCANLRDGRFNRARLEFVDLSNADLTGLHAQQSLFLWVNATQVKIDNASLAGVKWRGGVLKPILPTNFISEFAEILQVNGLVSLFENNQPPKAPDDKFSLQVYSGTRCRVTACCWNNTGSAIALGDIAGSIKFLEAETAHELFSFSASESAIRCLAWHNDGMQLLIVGEDGSANIWDVTTGKLLRPLQAGPASILYCVWSPDGSRVAGSTARHGVKIWDAYNGHLLQETDTQNQEVQCCCWGYNGKKVIFGKENGQLIIWDTSTGKLCPEMVKNNVPVMSCAWTQNEEKILVGLKNGSLHFFDDSVHRLGFVSGDTMQFIKNCGWVASGAHFFSVDPDSFSIWDSVNKKRVFTRVVANIVSSAISPAGNRLFISTTSGRDCIYRLDKKDDDFLEIGFDHSDAPTWCELDPSGERLAIGMESGVINILNLETFNFDQCITDAGGYVVSCPWSPDGIHIASTDYHGEVRTWNARTGKRFQTFKGDTRFFTICGWSPDGRRLAAVAEDNAIWIWNTWNTKVSVLKDHDFSILDFKWSPDGNIIAVASEEGSLLFLNPLTGQIECKISAHEDIIRYCEWHPDSKRILTCSDDGSIATWDARTHRLVERIALGIGELLCCARSETTALIACGGSNGLVAIVDSITGGISTFEAAHGFISRCAWHPSKQLLITCSETIKAWEIPSQECKWGTHHLPNKQFICIGGDKKHILHATPEAWRWLGWEERDAKGRFIRRLPAEAFGPIPGMED